MLQLDVDIPCSRCGGSLRGVSLNAACPKCGLAVGDTLAVPVISQEDLTVRADVSCSRCGYNLRTLPIASRCPECGQDVAMNLRCDHLHFAPPGWLQRMGNGAGLWAMAHIGPPVSILGPFVSPNVLGGAAVVSGIALTPFLLGIGTIVISEPRPDVAIPGVDRHSQLWASWLVLVSLLLAGSMCVAACFSWMLLGVCVALIGFYPARAAIRIGQWGRDRSLQILAKVLSRVMVAWIGLVGVGEVLGALGLPQLQANLLNSGAFRGGFARIVAIAALILALLTYAVSLATSLRCWHLLRIAARQQPKQYAT